MSTEEKLIITFEKATEADVPVLSKLPKEVYQDNVSDDQTDPAFLGALISEQHCVFDIAVDESDGEHKIVGLAWWYFHMPKGWPGEGKEWRRKDLSQGLFGSAVKEPKDFSSEGFDIVSATWINASNGQAEKENVGLPRIAELDEPVLSVPQERVPGKGIAEGLSLLRICWAVENNVRVLTFPTESAFKLRERVLKAMPNLIEQLYEQQVYVGPPGEEKLFSIWGTCYGVNSPYPKECSKLLHQTMGKAMGKA
ncbi:hypothetical protein DL764_006549 [Monosporascus ibericus]|uniref:Uncharacterized protein n=1 Tax=Monosporascus ibericus TaxID=155417 RepID=A0A4Q4T4J6_9PEZI|nr:hypothetical protein DL764_006549 [Monosporascus ibericus]